MSDSDQTSLTNKGVIVAVHGSVVDVRFDAHLPPIYSVLRAGAKNEIVIEVLAQSDAHHVRGIALTPTQGLARGMPVEDTGGPLQAPVGKGILSRMFDVTELHLFYNRPTTGAGYEPVSQRLLPLDETWRRKLGDIPWPAKYLPEVIGGGTTTLRALIREYLFVSIFRACVESLASENASRLAAMQRADKNIDELLVKLHGTFHQLRQSSIDEELFDVISGFDALSHAGSKAARH